MKKITLNDIKTAMRDVKFRLSLPPELKDDIAKYEKNPGCACNLSVYKNIIRLATPQIQEYFGKDSEIENIEPNLEKLAENNWTVINCHVNELENKLKALPKGRKQISIARYEDLVTVIVNELNYIY